MFIRKKDFIELVEKFDNLEHLLKYEMGKVAVCKECGCMVEKISGNRGNAVVRKSVSMAYSPFSWKPIMTAKESIHHDYYCKKHNPKNKKAKKKSEK